MSSVLIVSVMQELLKKNKDLILRKWIAYGEGPSLSKREPHPLLNPASHIIHTEWQEFYESLSDGNELCAAMLQETIRLKAIQQQSPSEALSFIHELRNLIRQTTGNAEGMKELEVKLDKVLMESFDLYMKNRELIFKLKMEEYKRSLMPGGGVMSFSCSSKLGEPVEEACS